MTDQLITTDLFRFVSERPVQEATPTQVAERTIKAYLPPDSETRLHQELRALYSQPNARERMLSEVNEFITGQTGYEDQFVADTKQDLSLPLKSLDEWIYSQSWPFTCNALLRAVRCILESVPHELVQNDAFQMDKRHLMDSTIALAIRTRSPHAIEMI